MTVTRERVRAPGGLGHSAARPDGMPKVLGTFAFSSDLFADSMVWGHVLRSPHPYARIRSIFRRAGEAGSAPGVTPELAAPEERALALALAGFAPAVAETIERLAPHRLCGYLFELAQAFTAFYDACPVLRDDVGAETRASRLALCDVTARTLATGLGLLGIEAPERM